MERMGALRSEHIAHGSGGRARSPLGRLLLLVIALSRGEETVVALLEQRLDELRVVRERLERLFLRLGAQGQRR